MESVTVRPLAASVNVRPSTATGSSTGPGAASREHEALEQVYRVISPLHRPPVMPAGRMLVLAAEADRITPRRHAERIAAHFGAPLHTFPGGHMLQLGRDRRLQHLAVLLRDLGVIPPA